jgi:hypothetical protein
MNPQKNLWRTNKDYERTPEDDEQDRMEREWKHERNQQMLDAFLRHHRPGHVRQYNAH